MKTLVAVAMVAVGLVALALTFAPVIDAFAKATSTLAGLGQ